MKILLFLVVLVSVCLMLSCVVYIHLLSELLPEVRTTNRIMVRYITTTVLLLYMIIFLTLFGCWAVIVYIKRMATFYVITTAFLIGIEIMCMLYFSDVNSSRHIRNSLSIMHYTGKLRCHISFDIDSMQYHYKCCGIDSYTEYDKALKWVLKDKQKIPVSCCPQADRKLSMDPSNLIYTNCHTNPLINNSYIGRGCFDLVEEQIESVSNVSHDAFCVCIVFEIFVILFGLLYLRFYEMDITL